MLMKRMILFPALLSCIAGCSRNELVPIPENRNAATLKIGIGPSLRSAMFNSDRENTVTRLILASYMEGFLASTEYLSADNGDFGASASLELPLSVNSGYR